MSFSSSPDPPLLSWYSSSIFFLSSLSEIDKFLFSLKKFLLHVSAQRLAVKLCCNSGLNVKRYSRTSKQIFKDFSHLFDCTTWPWKLSRFFFLDTWTLFTKHFAWKFFCFADAVITYSSQPQLIFPQRVSGKTKSMRKKIIIKKKIYKDFLLWRAYRQIVSQKRSVRRRS